MRNKRNRVLGFALSLVLVAGMLPVSVFATDCSHTELKKGVCQNKSCGQEFEAAVGETLYKEFEKAVQDAAELEDPAVTVLTDLKDLIGQDNAPIDLGEVYLVVEGDEQLTFENCSFIGENAQQVLYNKGKLILKDVSIENTAGAAVHSEQTEGENLLELSVIGGSYAGKHYAMELKQTKLQLSNIVVDEETVKLPVFSGEKAEFLMDDSAIEVLCDLGNGVLNVENRTPGVFAFVSDYEEDAAATAGWFKSVNATAAFDGENKQWSVPDSITAAVTLDKTVFTYNGTAQAPVISKAELYGKELTADTDYTVSYTQNGEVVEKTVNVGKYKMIVSGKGNYSDTYEAEYEIKAATPAVTWNQATEQLGYTGKDAVPASKVTVTLENDEVFDGEITYAHRAGNTGEFKAGLPSKSGTYEVKAAVEAFGNYTAAETETMLQLTIGKKTDAKLSVEITTPDGGHTYTGSEIRPEVIVKEGETVVSSDQYEVFYKDNINVGTATVTVKAKENGSYVFEDLTATFEIKKAAAAALTISGQPASVTSGDKAFKLNVSGGISGEAVVWSVTEGSSIASVSADGTVTVSGAGKVKIKAAQNGSGNYDAQNVEWAFEVKPAVLTVDSVAAENKTYDGNKAVTIKSVTLKGIIGSDAVNVDLKDLKGELANAKVGTYDKVTVPALTLSGADAANYTLTQPTTAVKTNVTIGKAQIPTALADIKTTFAADTVDLVVEKLGEGMPADAGTMTFATKHQDTSDGATLIVLDWKVDANGKLTSKLVPGKAGEQVLYDVTISSENYKDATVKVIVTFGSLELDASKVTVTPAESELPYNGKEQKPAVEVKYGDKALTSGTDYEVSYPTDTTNAGEKELTVKFKGNYSGSATAKYTITKAKVSVSGVQAKDKTYDGTTTATVTATLSGAVSGDDVKVSAVGIFANKNSGSGKTVTVTYKLEGADAANYELTATSGTTTARISPVSASSLSSQISGLSLSNADSGNKYALQTVINRANAALEDTGLSSSEKSAISNVKWNAEDMISRIESAAAAAATESIRKSAEITKENVTLNDKALLEKAQSDLNSALSSYSGNYTKAEETELGTKKTRVADALNVITRVQSAQTLIGALPAQITEDTVIDTALQTSVNSAKAAFDALNDYEKSLVGDDAQLKLTTVVNAADGKLPADDAEKNEVMNQVSGAPEEGEGFKFPTWILLVAVIAALGCGVAFVLIKRKQEENEYNW